MENSKQEIMKRAANASPESTGKLLNESVRFYVMQLATALDVALTPERILIYIQALSDLSPAHVEYAFRHALKYFKPEYGVMFPVPAELRQWALQHNPEAEQNSRRILSRSVKPPGWEPVDPAEVREWMAAALAKLGSATAMDKPVPEGPQKNKAAAAIALERLGGSRMPADPWESGWHAEIAAKNGWKS